MSEGDVQAEIRLALGRRPDVRLWRNAIGDAWQGKVLRQRGDEITLEHASRVKFGIAYGAGGSDLIGCRQVTITPDMVGQTIAQFVALEVKPPKGGRFQPGQREFVAFVNSFGGIAGVVRSPDDALALVEARVMAGTGAA